MSDRARWMQGPWVFVPNADNTGSDREITLGNVKGRDYYIARVWSDVDHAEGNARLLAAAPDMYSALESAAASLEQLVKIGRIPANNQGLRDARAALAKARGETP